MARYFKKSSKDPLEVNQREYRDRYRVFGKTGDEDDPIPYGSVTAKINKEQNFPNFDFSAPDSKGPQYSDSHYTKVAKNVGVSREYMERHTDNYMFHTNGIYDTAASGRSIQDNRGTWLARRLGIAYAQSIRTFKNDQDFQPTELFTSTPKSVTITEATVDPSLKSSFLTIGAMIHKEHGVPITASEDLSRWSSAVSRNAQKKGLPVMGHEDNPDMTRTNDIDSFQHYPFNVSKEQMEELTEGQSPIPDYEVKSARQHLRSMLKHPPKDTSQHLSPQFSQNQLPGMENF